MALFRGHNTRLLLSPRSLQGEMCQRKSTEGSKLAVKVPGQEYVPKLVESHDQINSSLEEEKDVASCTQGVGPGTSLLRRPLNVRGAPKVEPECDRKRGKELRSKAMEDPAKEFVIVILGTYIVLSVFKAFHMYYLVILTTIL